MKRILCVLAISFAFVFSSAIAAESTSVKTVEWRHFYAASTDYYFYNPDSIEYTRDANGDPIIRVDVRLGIVLGNSPANDVQYIFMEKDQTYYYFSGPDYQNKSPILKVSENPMTQKLFDILLAQKAL